MASANQALRKKIQSCYELVCNKMLHQAERELTKLEKKHKGNVAIEALQIWLKIIQHKSYDDIDALVDLQRRLEIMEEDDQVPLIIASAFKYLGRMDKAAETFGIFAERFGRIIYYEQYFDYLVRSGNLDDQPKVARKLYQLDNSPANRYRLCVATYLQAAKKNTFREREMGLKYASMLADRILNKDEDKVYRQQFVAMVEKNRQASAFADKLSDHLPAYKNPSSKAIDKLHDELLKLTDFASTTTNEDVVAEFSEQKKKYFLHQIDTVKKPNRDWANWSTILEMVEEISRDYLDLKAYEKVVEVFDENMNKHGKLEQDALLALVMFLEVAAEKAPNFGLGTPAVRLREYVRRFGNRLDTADRIESSFASLSSEDQTYVREGNLAIVQKLMKYLSPYLIKENYSRKKVKIPLPDAEEFKACVNKDGCEFLPSTFSECLMAYYQRRLLDECLAPLCSGPTRNYRVILSYVNEWDNALQLLDNFGLATDNTELLVVRVIQQCAVYLWVIYTKYHNIRYIEILVCFITKQTCRFRNRNQAIELLLLNCYLELGLAQSALEIYENLSVKPLQAQSMGYMCDYALESNGMFNDAFKFYENMSNDQQLYMMEEEDCLVWSYRDGRAELALSILNNILENTNSLQRAIQYSRRHFNDVVLHSKDCKDLVYNYIHEGWPTEHPYDHRDFQLFLKRFPIPTPSYAAYMKDRAFNEGLCEIHTLYLLIETLYTIANITDDSTSVDKLDQLHEHINLNMVLISGHIAKKPLLHEYLYTNRDTLRSRVVVIFMDLTRKLIASVKVVADQKTYTVDNILANLLSIRDYQFYFEQIDATIHGIFREKNNYGMRMEALGITLKMLHYIAQLLGAMFVMVSNLLASPIEQFKTNRKLKRITDRFKRYSDELRLIRTAINTLGTKFARNLSRIETYIGKNHDSDLTEYSTHKLLYERCRNFKISLANLRHYQKFHVLSHYGIIERE